MKKIKKWKKWMAGLLALALLLTMLPMYSREVQAAQGSGDFIYDVNADESSVVITGYTGSGGDVTIPSEIDEKSVTSIGDYAFADCSGLTGINIPDSVTNIGMRAFDGCSSLTRINISPNVVSIGQYAFDGCTSLTEISIPAKVTSIESGVFANCSNLAAITVEEGNTKYDSRENCNAIIETKRKELVAGCKNTTIPSGVKSIGWYAFSGCSGLTQINIPSGVESIGEGAFFDCSSLKEINLSDSVVSIDDIDVFSGCTSLEVITVAGDNEVYDSRDNCNAIIEKESGTLIFGCKNTVIPDSVTCIYEGAFEDCSGLTEINIPDSVTRIGGCAFMGCSSLASISISSGVKIIGEGAFADCSSLTDIRIPDSVTRIGMYAFLGCSSLTEINIPSGVEIIGGGAFADCGSLAAITVEEGNAKYDSRESCNAIIEKESEELVAGCKNTIIPDNVTGIGAHAFSGCISLTEIRIPGSVTSIGDSAFSGCSSLTEIRIPSGVTSIGECAFLGCISLTEAGIPDSVTKIGKGAFGYSKYDVYDEIVKIPGFVIYGESGSMAETYATTEEFTFETVSDNHIRWADVTLSQTGYVYDGTAKTPTATVNLEGKTLVPDIDYTVSYSDNTEAGTAKVTVTGTGNYAGDVEKTYTIDKADIAAAEVSLEKDSYEYDGQAKTPAVTVKLEGKTLVPDTDYTVSYDSNTEAGTAKATVTGTGNYTGSVKKTYTIDKADITAAEVSLEKDSYEYDGEAKTPAVTVKLGGKTLVPDTDYTVSYSGNTHIGTAVVTVAGKGNYTGSKTVNFTISKPGDIEGPDKTDISTAAVTLDKTSYTYDGTAKTPTVTVKLEGKTLVPDTDYTVSYSGNTNIGTATVTVTGKGDYTGTKSVNFAIVKAAENPPGNLVETPEVSITCKKTVYKVAYGTKPFKLEVVSEGRLTFTSSDSRIVSVDKNTGKVTIKDTGIATITVKAGTNTVKVAVKVSPKKPSLKSVKVSKSKKLTVKWAKDKKASGYQVQISTSRNFKKNKKQKNVKKTSCTFKKLKAGKKYYVRVRSYKKSGREKLYSAWSKVKKKVYH